MNRAERRRLKKVSGASPTPDRPRDFASLRHDDMVQRGMRAFYNDDQPGAEILFRAVLDENIDHPGALHGMALIARARQNWDVGAELIRRALLGEPRNADMYNILGQILASAERVEEAIAAYKLGLRFAPKHTALLNNLGSIYMRTGQRSEALAAYKKSLDLGETSAQVLTNYATALSDVGQFDRAEPFYRRMLEIVDQPSEHEYYYGSQLLKNGFWREGWIYYQRRFLWPEFQEREANFRAPMWDGGEIGDRSILLWGEQGIGDEIRYGSMVREVLAQGGDIVVECSPKLVGLFERTFATATITAAPYLTGPLASRRFDLMCPFASLGQYYRSTAADFPDEPGYLEPDRERTAMLADRLAEIGTGPFVGVCWRSGLSGAFRSDYYTTLSELRPVFETEGVTFVNLQYDVTEEEVEEARSRFGVTLHRWPDVDLFNDLDAAAALTKNLDLVVSAATSVSCMAGALGVRTWEFRPTPVPENYLIDGRCPWFASLRYFDKRLGEPWSKVFRRIGAELRTL